MKIAAYLMFAVSTLWSTCCLAQQTQVQIRMKEPAKPLSFSRIYSVQCPQAKYELVVSDGVTLQVDGQPVALQDASFGSIVMMRNMVGKLAFTCGRGLNAYFVGFELINGDTMKPVTYFAVLQADG